MKSLKNPALSVLVTVYNREDFLAECLESVLASTFKEFEVVVVDDCSTDGSFDVAQRYGQIDSRIRVSRNPTNLGDYPNRMRAAGLARGKYLKYVDSDDLIYPYGLGIMVEAMDRFEGSGLGLSQRASDDAVPYPFSLSSHEAWHREFLDAPCMGCGPSGAIIRKESFEEIGGFRNYGVLSDRDLWLRMSMRWPIVLLPPALVWWRRHEGQEFCRPEAALYYFRQGFQNTQELLNRIDCPLSNAERIQVDLIHKRRHARGLIRLALRQRKPRRAIELFREAGLSYRHALGAISQKPG